ncbi:MAG: hypothetical protein ACRCRZ_01040 [Metamycoplasmataceae bacterium]
MNNNNYKTKIVNINGIPTQIIELPIQNTNHQMISQQQIQKFAIAPQQISYNYPENYLGNNMAPNNNNIYNQPQALLNNESNNFKPKNDDENLDDIYELLNKEGKEKFKTLKFLLKRGEINFDEFMTKIRKISYKEIDI